MDSVARLQATSGFPDVRQVRPGVSDPTVKLIARLCARDPDRRHITWDQVLVDLERRISDEPAPTEPGSFKGRLIRLAAQHPYGFALAATVPAVIAAVLLSALIAG